MRWATLYRHPPILHGVSALQIHAAYAANQERITARCKPDHQRSDELTSSFHVYLHQRISNWDRLGAPSLIGLAAVSWASHFSLLPLGHT